MNIPNTYTLIQTHELPDIRSTGYLLRHNKSGARIVLLENDDENKVFSIAFRTPPTDSTGVPHIMEHSVLCGSKDFPVKDPFVELVKGSLNTFLNAMTFPDKTMYPVASCNDKDFKNLMHVYMDAVLYPNIYRHPEIFKQEGWSYCMDDPDGELTINGVVYNEMKGVFSSPDDVLNREIFNMLFPDTCYGVESGGDPDVIPELTYEQFLAFHRTYYHPSNSYICLYGDMDMTERLEWMDEAYLCHFDRIEIDSGIALQTPFDEIVKKTIEYPVGEDESTQEATYLTYTKVIGESGDALLMQAMDILDYALLSAPGAPLEKALLESGIGQDVIGTFESDLRQPFFSIMVKNSEPDRMDQFLDIIRTTLEKIVSEGIDKNALLAAINYFEFRVREADTGRMPKGLLHNITMMSTWLYDEADPWSALETLDNFAYLRSQIDTGYFEQIVQEYFLDNQFGAYVMAIPRQGLGTKREKELAEKLSALRETLTEAERRQIAADTEALRAYQEAPETKEDREKIPLLERSDLRRNVRPYSNTCIEAGDAMVVSHAYETNGIGYLRLLFDVSDIPEDLVPYLSLLQSTYGIIDTEHYAYADLFNEINKRTGGISVSLNLVNHFGAREKEGAFSMYLELKGKALTEEIPFLFTMAEEILCHSKFDDTARLNEILLQTTSRLQAKFMSAGHATAVARANRNNNAFGRYKDAAENLTFYRTMNHVVSEMKEHKDTLSKILFRLAAHVVNAPLTVSYTGNSDTVAQIIDETKRFQEQIRCSCPDNTDEMQRFIAACTPADAFEKKEALTCASAVQYVCRLGDYKKSGLTYSGAMNILRPVLNYDYLWNQIRVTGGAYGCMGAMQRNGTGYFVSYRDPHLKRTDNVFAGIPAYLREFDCDERTMTKFIIGAVSDLDMPLMPEALGSRSMNAFLAGMTEEMIQKDRDEVLDATPADIRALAKHVQAVMDDGILCVVGGEEKIKKSAELFDTVEALL